MQQTRYSFVRLAFSFRIWIFLWLRPNH